MTELTLKDPRFSAGDACKLVGLNPVDLANWVSSVPLGSLVPTGGRTFRKFSAMDLLALRLMLALTGPTSEGSRQRTFLTPLHAFCSVEPHQPLHRYVEQDSSGYLKPPGPVSEQSFLVVHVQGGDDHLTSTVMTGDEVMGRLGQIESQALVVPLTRIAHSVVRDCRDFVMKKAKHVRAVAQLADSIAQAAEDGR